MKKILGVLALVGVVAGAIAFTEQRALANPTGESGANTTATEVERPVRPVVQPQSGDRRLVATDRGRVQTLLADAVVEPTPADAGRGQQPPVAPANPADAGAGIPAPSGDQPRPRVEERGQVVTTIPVDAGRGVQPPRPVGSPVDAGRAVLPPGVDERGLLAQAPDPDPTPPVEERGRVPNADGAPAPTSRPAVGERGRVRNVADDDPAPAAQDARPRPTSVTLGSKCPDREGWVNPTVSYGNHNGVVGWANTSGYGARACNQVTTAEGNASEMELIERLSR